MADAGRLDTRPGIWAGGDAREGNLGTVTSAVGDGRRAVLAMARFIADQEPPEERSRQTITCSPMTTARVAACAPASVPVVLST